MEPYIVRRDERPSVKVKVVAMLASWEWESSVLPRVGKAKAAVEVKSVG